MFRSIRIAVLLLVLFIVAVTTWQQRVRSTRWTVPLYVAIYPVAADASPLTRAYVQSLDAAAFLPIDEFFAREGARYGLHEERPVKTRLRPALDALPPQRAPDAGLIGTILWSLKLRGWAWRVSGRAGEPEDIRVFVLYRDPQLAPTVPHSAGLEKGLIGVVYAFATPVMTGTNDVVIAHEMLHTLGATDKYDPSNDAPLFPDGYGDPAQQPRFPQLHGEIMAGRVMISPTRWAQIPDLTDAVIGPATAAEIRWPSPAAGAAR
jgi:hypothetical protein